MNLQLKSWRVFEFQISEKQKDVESGHFDLDYSTYEHDENEKEFIVTFELNIVDERYKFHLIISYLFEADDIVTDEFINGEFANQNAPAIAFPYVRAYISNVTLQSGFHPVILPSVNFVHLYKSKLEEAKNR